MTEVVTRFRARGAGTRRGALLAAAVAALSAPALRAHAQGGWPDRPIRLIYPFATGVGDFLARAIGDRMRETIGQPFVVDNRPGANTMIGAEAAARAPKDGYTLGWVATSTLALNPHFYPNITYRLEDFAPLCLVYRAPVAFAATAELPVRDLAAALEHIRRNPGLGVGSVGNGSTPHLTMELLMSLAPGVKLQNVAYRGEAAILADLISGRVPFYAGSTNSLLPHREGGKFRILALSAPERLAVLPDVPTFRESGWPDLVVRYWHGLAAPAGVPEPVLQRLSDGIAAVVRGEFLRSRATPDMQLDPLQRDAFTGLIRQDAAFFGRLIRERNITV
jgi:tripartite-type tricarboxylate transporter receptor subunit TctC